MLLAILANPPLTAGTRTLRRLDVAAKALSINEIQVANLFAHASYRTTGISAIGGEVDGWELARIDLSSRLDSAEAILLAYGVATPTGAARGHFLDQVQWLYSEVGKRNIPTWQLGDGPRHPSRWQRWTHRVHPGLKFDQAVSLSLGEVSSTDLQRRTR